MERSKIGPEATNFDSYWEEFEPKPSWLCEKAEFDPEWLYEESKPDPNPQLPSIGEILKSLPSYGDPIFLEANSPAILAHKSNLYCGEGDETIKSYDLIRKKWTRPIPCHGSSIKMNCISSDGSFICSSSSESIVISSTKINGVNKVLKMTELNDFCITYDNKLLITATKSSLAIWSLEKSEQLEFREGHNKAMICLKVTSQNILYSVAEVDNSIWVWDISNRKQIKTLEGYACKINCLQLTINENWILSGYSDGKIRIWSTSENKLEQTIETELGEVLMIEVSANGQYFASANQWIKIWSFHDFSEIFKIESEPFILYLKISIDSRFLIAGGDDSSIKIYNINQQRQVESLSLGNGPITGLYESIDPPYLIASSSQSIGIWNIERRSLFSPSQKRADPNEYNTIRMKMTRDGKYAFLAISEENSIVCWDIHQMKKMWTIEDPSLKCECIEITRDDAFLISNSISNNLMVWNCLNRELTVDLPAHENSVCLIYATKDCNFLLSASEEGQVAVWNIGSWNQAAIFEVNTRIYCIEETQSEIICECQNFRINFWSKATWTTIRTLNGHEGPISYLKLLYNNRFLISGSEDSTIKIWNLSEVFRIRCLSSENFPIRCIRIAQEEEILAASSNTNIIKIWRFDGNDMLVNLENRDFVNGFEMIHSDKFIVACLDDGGLVLWNLKERTQIAVFVDYGRPLKILENPCDDCMIVMGSCDRIVSVYNIKNLVSKKSQWGSLSVHCDDLFETMTSFSIKRFINPKNDDAIESFSKITIFPLRINCLHCYCWDDNAASLKQALDYNPTIIRDLNGSSPLTYAISIKAQRSLIELLRFISEIEDEVLRILYFHAIRYDIPKLFRLKVNIIPFLSCLLRKQGVINIEFAVPRSPLPNTIFIESATLSKLRFVRPVDLENKSYAKLVQYWTSPFGWNFSLGSFESLMLLKAIRDCEELTIYNTDFIKFLINQKWKSIWYLIFILSIIFWCNLGLMVIYFLTRNKDYLNLSAYINIPLIFFEIISCGADLRGYFKSFWNYLDIFRFIMVFLLADLEPDEKSFSTVGFLTVAANFLVGLLYFRVFDKTRFYVRLIIRAFLEAFPFLVILLYSIFAFTVIYATTDEAEDIRSAWKKTYEIEAGGFDNSNYSFLQYLYFTFAVLINVIVLLNLLVSVLGDSFEKSKEEEEELDTKEKLIIIIEMETLIFIFKFGDIFSEKTQYMQRCDYFRENIANSIDEDVKEMRSEFKNSINIVNEDAQEMKRGFRDLKAEIGMMKSKMDEILKIIQSK